MNSPQASDQPSNQSPIVGIDLGTTNSVVAAIINGQPQVIPCDDQPSMPSVVGLTPNNTMITGVVARNQLAAFPDRTAASIKRKMGSQEAVTLGDQTYTPPEISAMILRRLRDVASRALQQDVRRAVITVPAYFDESQRQATRAAGELAGLTVERIINEPTAATLVYHADSADRKHIAVFDFGGGTFDVSVVRMEAGVTEVLSSQGDTQLGGDDLDEALLNHVADQFQQEHDVDLRDNVQARYRLLHACEQAKIGLSEATTAKIAEEFIIEKDGQPLNLEMTIDRSTFEELIEPMIDRTVDCVSKALRDCSLTIHQVDDLVLVGGSTRTPLVAQRLREQFQREPSRAVDPDLAVGLGAAVQAAMIDHLSVGRVLVDVATHTLGVEACDGMTLMGPNVACVPIIHRNSPLPARYEEAFSTMHDDQKGVVIRVYQGEHTVPERNTLIGEFDLDLQTGEAYRKIVVSFNLTLDGILRVVARQPASGRSDELTIDNALALFTEEERARAKSRLDEMFDQAEEILDADEVLAKDDAVRFDTAHDRLDYNGLMAKAQETFPQAATLLTRVDELRGQLSGEDADDLDDLRDCLYTALEAEDASAVEKLTAELDDLLFYVQ